MKIGFNYFFCICAFCFFSTTVKGQYIIAGVNGGIYVDITPDTLLNPPIYFGSHNESYSIDINQDAINDIEIDAVSNSSSGAYNWYVKISALNANVSFSLGYIDSNYIPGSSGSCSAYWLTRPILEIYDVGDSIKSSNYVSLGYLGYRNNVAQCQVDIWDTSWVNIGDVFFGVKYQTASDTSFGWVKINVVQVQSVLIKEFSLETNPLSALYSNRDINDFVLVYPNPANTLVNIYAKNNSIINVSDLLGKKVKQFNVINQTNSFDISDLPNGIYFINIWASENTSVKKLIIRH